MRELQKEVRDLHSTMISSIRHVMSRLQSLEYSPHSTRYAVLRFGPLRLPPSRVASTMHNHWPSVWRAVFSSALHPTAPSGASSKQEDDRWANLSTKFSDVGRTPASRIEVTLWTRLCAMAGTGSRLV